MRYDILAAKNEQSLTSILESGFCHILWIFGLSDGAFVTDHFLMSIPCFLLFRR
ncbi:hypothetical protein [Anaerocolumna sp.]|uniref:hypothetical protein n=1 Tax=Anaerocolumna sp. TaxID=2041569 RepID=UPI0028A961E0|nr:hypothetical protein [Anaerocolumna sp.]